ncbi:MAG: two-component regulator propeller domain-containing protein [Acidobacteriota bacterium]
MSPFCWRRGVKLAAIAAIQCVVAGGLVSAPEVYSQQLSVRRYSVSDGLPHRSIRCIYQDAKGYLWFGTADGLSRFDGYRFINYAAHDGLEHPVVNSITEDPQGRMWVGTWGSGVARLVSEPQEALSLRQRNSRTTARKFVTYPVGSTQGSNEVSKILFDADSRLWCFTNGGIYRALATESEDPQFELVLPAKGPAFADSRGHLWFVVGKELLLIVKGQVIRYGLSDEVVRSSVVSMVEDQRGRLLVSNSGGVFEFIRPTSPQESTPVSNTSPDPKGIGRWDRLPITLMRDERILTMANGSSGVLWIGTSKGLIKYQDGSQSNYTSAQLSAEIGSLYEDRDGNLWMGTRSGLLCKLSGEAIVSFTEAEGLPDQNVQRVIEDREGRMYASTHDGGIVEILNEKAVPVPGSQAPPFNSVRKRVLQDRRGDWWIGTDKGLYRFPGPKLQLQHGKKVTAGDGRSEIPVFSGPGMHEDPGGKLWISSRGNLFLFGPGRQGSHTRERFQLAKMSSTITDAVLVMIGDSSGALWLGGYGGLGRLINGKIQVVEPAEGLPDVQARAFFQDSRGRLWIGLRYRGVSMTTDPTAEPPKFVNYSTENGLASDTVHSIAEDNLGRLYFATNKGVDQVDLTTGNIRHFTTADGLAGNEINDCFRDSRGDIWIGTETGLSRFNPRTELTVRQPPPIYLSRLQVAGEEVPLPETGAISLPAFTLPGSQNNIMIEYVGLSFQGGRQLKYQYKLEGVDADWNPPTEQRSLNLARLGSGAYRFLVRAIDEDGLASPEPAMLEFRILSPIWQRWWFMTLAAMLVGLAAYAIVRYRVARLIELERVRTRIATDLHDDIGSNLSRIAILSEVVSQQVDKGNLRVIEPLSTIAATSRELVDSMSDIVWAINPNKDHLSDLTQRMRRFASDIFTARKLEFSFRAPSAEAYTKVGADVRRQVFLIFKESVSNLMRHSACTRVDIELQIEGGWLDLTLKDNGKGFDLSHVSHGHGLKSMTARAKSLGGQLDIISNKAEGTIVTLKAPLAATVKRKGYGER